MSATVTRGAVVEATVLVFLLIVFVMFVRYLGIEEDTFLYILLFIIAFTIFMNWSYIKKLYRKGKRGRSK